MGFSRLGYEEQSVASKEGKGETSVVRSHDQDRHTIYLHVVSPHDSLQPTISKMSDEEQDIKYILHTRQRTPTCNSTDGSEYHPPTPDPTPRSKRARQSSVKGEDQKPWVEISDDDHFDVKGGGKLGRKSSNNQGIRGNRTGKRGRPAGVGRGDSSRKMGSWTKEEVRQLWDAMGFLPVGSWSYWSLCHQLMLFRSRSSGKTSQARLTDVTSS